MDFRPQLLVSNTLEPLLFVSWNQEKESSGFPSSMEDTKSSTNPGTNVSLPVELKEVSFVFKHRKSTISSAVAAEPKVPVWQDLKKVLILSVM